MFIDPFITKRSSGVVAMVVHVCGLVVGMAFNISMIYYNNN